MEIGDIKKRLQDHFTDGLVTVIGSGLSMDSGMPGMENLASHLIKKMSERGDPQIQKEWGPIASHLSNGVSLEESLKDIQIDNPVLEHVVNVTASFMESHEREVIRKVCSGKTELPLVGLLPYLAFNTSRVTIITSNYDRLIEFSAEIAGYGIDTLFPGQYYGKLDPELSRESLWTGKQAQKGKNIKRVFRKHVFVLKPHGSLDWFSHNGEPVRCTIPIEGTRLLITPGHSKYRMGYEQPFDQHRNAANQAIDNAARFLIIGYGFNDDQLETHLKPEIKRGKSCLILTKLLSDKAQKLLRECPSVLAVSATEVNHRESTEIIYDKDRFVLEGSRIWRLHEFIREILK